MAAGVVDKNKKTYSYFISFISWFGLVPYTQSSWACYMSENHPSIENSIYYNFKTEFSYSMFLSTDFFIVMKCAIVLWYLWKSAIRENIVNSPQVQLHIKIVFQLTNHISFYFSTISTRPFYRENKIYFLLTIVKFVSKNRLFRTTQLPLPTYRCACANR